MFFKIRNHNKFIIKELYIEDKLICPQTAASINVTTYSDIY
jgi:hypothetical protein